MYVLPGTTPSCRRALQAATLALLIALPAGSAFAQVDLLCSDDFTPVDPALFNPVFGGIFDIAVDWDLSAPDAPWNGDSLRIFANAILDEWPQNNEDLLTRLVSYFAEDLDDSYGGLRLRLNGGEYDRFHICLRASEGDIYSAGNRVEIACVVGVAPGEERVLSTQELAQEGFAHEWQHVTYDRISAGPKFNGNTGTSEFLSKCAEFVAGNDRMWPVHDNPYERSYLGGRDYYATCVASSHADHKYGSFALLGAYLIEHFQGVADGSEDDLLSLWLNSNFEDLFGNILYRISPSSLAALLAGEEYDDYFSAAGGAARLEELFHEFALSLWVNSPSLAGEATVWAGGRLPQESYQLFRNVNGIDCADDARSLPLRIFVGEESVEVMGPIYPADVYGEDSSACEGGYGSEEYPRYPQVSTYGSSYLPFTASELLPPDRCHDLVIDLELLDQIFCEGAGETIPVEGSSNLRLNLSVIGYREARDSLDLRGSGAVEIAQDVIALGELPLEREIRIPCFGSGWQSVVLVLSVTELNPSQGYVWNRIFPFSYSARAESSSLPEQVDKDEILGGAGVTLCLDGDLRVMAGARLTLLPGTELLAVAPGIEIEVLGEFLVQGEPQRPVSIRPAADLPLAWGEILVGAGGRLKMRHAEIRGLQQLAGIPGSRIELSELDWDCGEQPGMMIVQGEGSRLVNLELRNFGRVHMAAGRLDSSLLVAAPLANGPLLELSGAVERCSYLTLRDARQGILATAPNTWLGPAVEVIGSPTSTGNPWGLRLGAGARLNTYGLSIRNFDTGIVSGGGASLVLRSSTVSRCGLGVLIEEDAAITDLGSSAFGAEGWGRNNFYGEENLPPDRAVENRTSIPCLAQWNYWGSAFPLSGLFTGPVSWDPYFDEHIDSGGMGKRSGDAPPRSAEILAARQRVPGSAVEFRFTVSTGGRRLRLSVYDVSGRRVATPIDGAYPRGLHTLRWSPRGLPSGVYFARIEGSVAARKFMLLR